MTRAPERTPEQVAYGHGYADALRGWGWNASGHARGTFDGPCDWDYRRGYLAGKRARGMTP